MTSAYEDQLLAKLEGGATLTPALATEAATHIRLLAHREADAYARIKAAEDAASVSESVIANSKLRKMEMDLAEMAKRAGDAEDTLAKIAQLIPY